SMTPPAVAAVVMSLESVFGALGGIWFLGERMNAPEIIGCALILTAVLTVELSEVGGKRKSDPPPPSEAD
ncbi:MAG: DMT family transporter, partial [Clostridia bacterium]|nr:DMT family transporter [Clostridia bacterium]